VKTLLPWILLALSAPALAEEFSVIEIAPGNYVHYGTMEERSASNLGDNANIGFVIGESCVLVIDTGGSLHVGRALRKAIKKTTSVPVCYVILTHAHPDHFFGAAAFLDDAAEFIGHENLPRQLAQRARPYTNSLKRDLGETLAEGSNIVPPKTVVKDQLELDLGGRKVSLRAWPSAHTDNDLTVYDQLTHTWWLSDLLFIRHTPVIDGSLAGFLDVIKTLRTLPAEYVVAGHGRSALPWPQPLDAQERYLKLMQTETRQALKNKKTIQQAVDEVGLSEQANWLNFEFFHRRNVTAAYTELEWED
jgi:quinoprotein relay system zinc metallohydrolase 2